MTDTTAMTVDEATRVLDAATLTPEMEEALADRSPSDPTVSVPVEALRVVLAELAECNASHLPDPRPRPATQW